MAERNIGTNQEWKLSEVLKKLKAVSVEIRRFRPRNKRTEVLKGSDLFSIFQAL
jgi:hypothetical protein